MITIEDQISILSHLSKADHVVAEEEYRLILKVAEGLGLSEEKTVEIINNPRPIPKLKDLEPEEKFDCLFNIITMMKIDGKVHSNEIRFCEKLALNLGYKPGVIADLSAYIYKDPRINSNRNVLRSIADQHLIPMDGKNKS